jgi:hypothetical protein
MTDWTTQPGAAGVITNPHVISGPWTPSATGTATHETQTGHFTKIGNIVTVTCGIEILALGTGNTTRIDGLPYPIKSGTQLIAPIFWTDAATNLVYAVAFGSGGTSHVTIRANPSADDDVLSSTTVLQDGTEVLFTATYLTD